MRVLAFDDRLSLLPESDIDQSVLARIVSSYKTIGYGKTVTSKLDVSDRFSHVEVHLVPLRTLDCQGEECND